VKRPQSFWRHEAAKPVGAFVFQVSFVSLYWPIPYHFPRMEDRNSDGRRAGKHRMLKTAILETVGTTRKQRKFWWARRWAAADPPGYTIIDCFQRTFKKHTLKRTA
jgi:hypothetical protein